MLVNFFWLLCLQRGAAFGSPAAPIGARMRLEDVTLTRELTRRFGPLSRSNGKRGVRREKNGEDKTGIKVEDSRLSEKTFHNSCAKNCRRPRGCGDRTCGAFGRRGSRARTAGRGEVAARAPAARSLLVCDPHGARATALARAAPLLRAHVPRRAYARVPHVHTIKKKKNGEKRRKKTPTEIGGFPQGVALRDLEARDLAGLLPPELRDEACDPVSSEPLDAQQCPELWVASAHAVREARSSRANTTTIPT